MKPQGFGLLAGAAGAALLLASCQTGTSPFSKDKVTTPGAEQGIVTMEQDIEAPDVFNLSGEALWDGRPSLGGVWVAHSSVKDPERVMIRNEKNGKSVVGALFRREIDNPGPSIQVSSDAAEALGMLAGQPAKIAIVALRRKEVDLTPASEVTPETEAAAVAAASPEAADTATARTAAEATDLAAAPVDGTAAPVAETPQKKRGLFAGLFKRKPKAEDTMSAPVAAGATVGAIDAAPLDPVVGTAAAGIAAAEAKQAAPAAQPALKRAYVQIGIFSTEANATRAQGQMQKAGLLSKVVPDQSNGKTYWRVIVGPADSVAGRDAMAAKVKGIGYPDAYPVSK